MTPSVRRAVVVLVVVSIAALVTLGYRWVESVTADPRPSVMGVRLGMTADDIRPRIDAVQPGSWTTELVAGDWVLEHRAGSDVARFEIHEGQLVAIRVDASSRPDLPTEPRFEVTPGSVLVRASDAGHTRITLLSRACPTHHDEAEALVRANVTAP